MSSYASPAVTPLCSRLVALVRWRLLPARYSGNSGRTLFALSGYNNSLEPINFGPDDVSMTLDDGTPLPVFDFDHIRHGDKLRAERQRVLATIALGAELYAASGGRHNARRGSNSEADRAALLAYDERLHSIAETLAYRTRQARQVLETTTLDPGTSWSGWVVGPEPSLAEGQTRRVDVVVRLAGETHRFSLLLAAEGTPLPAQADLPAAPRRDAELALYGTPSTWLWNLPSTSISLPDTREETPVYRSSPY